MSQLYPPTARTTATRYRDRMDHQRAAVHDILDEAFDCTVAFVVDGEPRVLPTLHVRIGETLYLHGSTGARLSLTARGDGVRACVSVTLLDGLVYARSQLNHDANYRSVIAHGIARPVTDPAEKLAVLQALVDKSGAGRAADSRPPTRSELARTEVLALPLDEVAARIHSGGVEDDPDDLTLPHWAGVLPLRRELGPPATAPGVLVAAPDYLPGRRSPWVEPVTLTGQHVRLEPLTPGHVEALFAALDDGEVWEHLPHHRPRTPTELADIVADLLAQSWTGAMFSWAQVEPGTSRVLGMTSYHDVDPDRRSLGIGHTLIGRPWWRTGVNTEAKLMLLEHAFERLGAERVFWYTDVRNRRSQQAIARLGASRDGVIRRHRPRPDGSWRDTVLFAMTADEWPTAAERLRDQDRVRSM